MSCQRCHSLICQCPPPIIVDSSDLIEQQAERIKELEAALHIAKHNEQCTHNANVNLCKEIAALRQRIDDAPVVAWMGEYNINDIRDHYTVVMRHKTDFDGMPERVRALVFKEDLK